MILSWIDPVSGETVTSPGSRRAPIESQILDEKWEREIHAADPEGNEWGA